MKYLLLAVPAMLLATQAFGQHIEYSARANAGFSEFRGEHTTATTAISTSAANGVESSRAVNPYGQHLGTGAGISLRAQRVGKAGLLTAFDLGFDWMQARATVNTIYYSNSSASYSRAASGRVSLYTPSITAFAGAGWRLGGQKLALDALVGPELAYVLDAREKGNGTSAVNGGWSTDVSRPPANRLDFRLRGDLTVWRNRVGLMGSFSTGFANYQPATTSIANPDASVRLLRVGLAYRLK
ncbi:hypothetical protein [Hymenobacter sp. BT559]|uniref:hypothetical protein n=1 Tax=Hymenobacter sp. BT559 TaxID=2795729 RepID=UPI0018EDA9CB|nr:hypothetical protein [Hymenobacter sp. BT559]MBJ6143481.1 hypothetical protein [Hymenobacter sp. BT559]